MGKIDDWDASGAVATDDKSVDQDQDQDSRVGAVDARVDSDNNMGLRRGLKSRHLSMMAIGGVIGPGYFVASGNGLHNGGPAGLIMGYAIVGTLLWSVMQSLGEMAAFISVTGSFTEFTSRLVDPAVGFSLGWNYLILWWGIITAEYNITSLVCTFWPSAMPDWGFILVANLAFLLFSFSGVRIFGEAEFFFSWLKILFILAFFLCSILITTGAIGDGGVIGFKYWRDPGAFSDGVRGVFKLFVFAAIYYSGTEMIGLTAGESKDPTRDIPRAVKLTFWRILVVYVGGMFFVSLVVAWDDPQLLTGTSRTGRSPFVLAFANAGLSGAGSVINAFILATCVSALNGALYVSSRCLVAMSNAGKAPKLFAKTNRFGAPWTALILCNTIGLLSLLNQSAGAGKLFDWIVSIGGVCTFITWASISLCHIRFRRALALQGISIDELPFRAPGFPFAAWYGLVGNVVLIFGQGWSCFLSPFDVEAFFMNYLMIPVFVVLALGYKLWHKTTWVDLSQADLKTGRREWIKEDEEVTKWHKKILSAIVD